MFGISLLICLACAGFQPATAAPPQQVDVELVLAVDISRSMDSEEMALQRAGYVEAVKDPAFLNAVRAGMHGRIALAYFEWAGTPRPESVLGWHVIDGPESAAKFAAALARRPMSGFRGTSISGALGYAAALLEANPAQGRRRVIDISGDGANNAGEPVLQARAKVLADGIVINGLPILVRPSQTARLDRYYADCVIGGPGSFVLPIKSAGEFKEAIRRKLVLEVSGDRPAIIPVEDHAATDCLIGEKLRRFYSDPYFPELDREPGR